MGNKAPTGFHFGVDAKVIFFPEFLGDRKNSLSLVERNILLSSTCNLSRGLGS